MFCRDVMKILIMTKKSITSIERNEWGGRKIVFQGQQ